MSASVVVCAYTVDRWDVTQRSIASVLGQDPPPDEVVLVIDHNLELEDRARSLWGEGSSPKPPGPHVLVVANRGRKGLSGARNTGVEVSSSTVIAFLDDDAFAEPGWLASLLAPYVDLQVAASGGAALPELVGTRPAWWPVEFDWVVGCSYLGMPVARSEVRNLIGANMSVRRALVTSIGGFTEGMGRIGTRPMGCEETELFIRISRRWPASRIVYEPQAAVRHSVPAQRLTWHYFRTRCWAEGRSKAQVAAEVGQSRALSAERRYTLRVLPRGVIRAVASACRGEPGAGRRALAIVAGVSITTAGYVVGHLTSFHRPAHHQPLR